MRNKKKQLLFGCLAALVLSAGAFPAFAQDQDSFSTNMESSSQNSVPVAVDITAVYGRNAKPGSFVPIKVSIYGQTEAPFSGTLTVSTLESDNDEGTEEYEYSYQVEVGPAETKTMEFYVPLEERDDPPDIKRREEEDHGGDLHGF